MRTAIIISKLTGVAVKCHATTEHPDSHFGCPVWVDDQGKAYCDVDKPSEYYEVDEDVDGNPRVVIGRRIAQLRAEKNMTQSDLAKASGVTLANVSRMERGMYSPGLDVLSKIADALGAKLDIV